MEEISGVIKMGVYERLADGINAYTGLSPTSFFVILTLMVITYKLVSSMFVHVSEEEEEQQQQQQQDSLAKAQEKAVRDLKQVYEQDMTREPVQLGRVTPEQLRSYDGSDQNKPLLMAIKGNIYEVSRGRMFYGPGGPYAMFAGRDATRALALMSFDPQDLTSNTDGLSEPELEVLQDWELKFTEKYPKVGVLVSNEEIHYEKENELIQQVPLESKKAV